MESCALLRFSLAKRNAAGDAFWIHPVVRLWTRERIGSRSRQTKTQEALVLCDKIVKIYSSDRVCRNSVA